MNIDILREFVVLGKSLNFTQAAQALHLDQSTLSRHLQTIEDEVGVTLISRSTRRAELTRAGRSFLGSVVNMLGSYDKGLAEARDLCASEVPTLVVGGTIIGGKCMQLLSYATAHVMKNHLPVSVEIFAPHARLSDLTKLSDDDPVELLRRGNLDMALIFGCEAGDWSGTRHQALCCDDFVLFVDEGHPLAARKSVSIADLAPYSVRKSIFYSRNNQRVSEVCSAHGFELETEVRVINSVDEWNTSYGKDDAFVYNASVRHMVAPTPISGLVGIPFDDPDAHFEAWAVWRDDDPNPGIPVFLDALAQVAPLT